MEQVDVVIIGAGVVGLAVAVELAGCHPNRSIVLVERNPRFGQEVSSRSSEVIHAGIYYLPGSLKARLCVEGNRQLYRFCAQWDVPHRKLGKLIIARDDGEIAELESLLARGRENGVPDLELIDRHRIRDIEPAVKAQAALYSPSSGIIDSHSLMVRLEWLARQRGVILLYRREVVAIEPVSPGYRVHCQRGDDLMESIECQWLVNCTGLASDKIAALAGIDIDQAGYRLRPCKGEYFSVRGSKAQMVSRLIYPPPLADLKGLGIHTTGTLDGRLRLGPNALFVEDLDYTVDSEHLSEFYNAVKTYLPSLESSDLQPDTAGIRPQLKNDCGGFRDFMVREESDRGLPGLVNLVGIESPGLTSCLSLASTVGNLVI